MATKLKNLKITKVDFVDEGANPDAHIMLKKRRDGAGSEEQEAENNSGSVWKRLFGFIGKAAGMDQEEIDSAVDEIQKGDSVGFGEKINEVKNRKIADEIWDVCYALQSSLCSILNDDDLDSASTKTAMQESLDEFHALVQESISKWSEGKAASIVSKGEDLSEADVEFMKSVVDRLNETIEKAVTPSSEEEEKNAGIEDEDEKDEKNPKGEEKMIDKSRMTEAERAFYESIEKRYAVDGDPTTPPTEDSVQKSAPQATDVKEPAGEPGQDDIYKGINPAVKAELEALKKFRQDTEDNALRQVAKKYAIIGKKEDELFPVLKSLKEAGGTAYDDMIAVLDSAVDTVEKSGAFTEIGKSGHGSANDGSAWTEAETKAVELMKSKIGLTKAQALDEVLMADADLAQRCEKED